ncbi:MAG: twin-arginine translocase TatA/TatE family subunit [Dongiaceae bacterium]
MGFGSMWHWVLVVLVILILFGAGKLPKVMGDMGKGIKSFKKGLNEEDDPKSIEANKNNDSSKV